MPPMSTVGGKRHCVYRSSVWLSVRLLSDHCWSINTYYVWRHFNETWHKYSPCKWANVFKDRQRSEVKGQGHSETKCTFRLKNNHGLTAVVHWPCIRDILIDGVVSRLTCIVCIQFNSIHVQLLFRRLNGDVDGGQSYGAWFITWKQVIYARLIIT